MVIRMVRRELLEEYKHLEETRKFRSQHIMDWMRIGMPVGGALFALFSIIGESWLLILLGWILFITPIITWRFAVCHIDRQIVPMYPRMLEIERELRWTTNTVYYYNNLSRQARRNLEDRLGVDEGWINDHDFRQYLRQCGDRDSYNLLLETWDRNRGRRSVGSRGPDIQNIAAISLVVVTGIIVLVLSISKSVT